MPGFQPAPRLGHTIRRPLRSGQIKATTQGLPDFRPLDLPLNILLQSTPQALQSSQ